MDCTVRFRFRAATTDSIRTSFSVLDRDINMVYSPTKPRGPISAEHSTPGPVYLLPGLVGTSFHDPRSVHSKQPAYSFGLRHGKEKDESSPGPCYFPNPRISRTGKDGTPHFSLYARRGDLKSDRSPGKNEAQTMRNSRLMQVVCTFLQDRVRTSPKREDR